jgi:hypothetical protein
VAKDVTSSYDVLVELFERIESFLTRLKIYSEIPLTTEMTTMLGKILAEVLTILALSTKEMEDRRISGYFDRDIIHFLFWTREIRETTCGKKGR